MAWKTEAAESKLALSRLHSWFYPPVESGEPAGYSYRAGKVKIKATPKFILTAYVYSGVVFFISKFKPINKELLLSPR